MIINDHIWINQNQNQTSLQAEPIRKPLGFGFGFECWPKILFNFLLVQKKNAMNFQAVEREKHGEVLNSGEEKR